MLRGLTLLLCTLSVVAGCSRDPERSLATAPTPTATAGPEPGSLLGPTSVAPGGVSGKYDVSFPGRDQSFDFRNQLETKYQTGLGRAAAATFVDREGEVVWTQEYMRYRVNGCDHGTATARVLAQVGGLAAGEVCGTAADGLILFPPRSDAFDFRRQLEARYQLFGRGASSSSVDSEGGVIWTQEYLRYRVNACDHATSIQKVFSQIDGGGVPATCYVPPCIFTISPTTESIPAAGGTFTAVVTKTQGENCSFTADSSDAFVTISGGASGGSSTTTTITYSVAPNFGAARGALIRVRWAATSARLEITQAAGSSVAFTLTDPNASGSNATTNCAIRTTATPCTLTASGSFSATAVYHWRVEYPYGGTASHDFSSTSSSFTFQQTCGGPGATAGGAQSPMSVTLTVTDGASSITAQSGVGAQPGLTITFFTCS